MRNIGGRFSQLTATVACLALVWAPIAPVVYAAPSAPDAGTALANSLRAIQDGENAAPRDHWDPTYVATQLADDPARTFAWVRDQTYWIPYHGVLRGATGVLMDRQGDSLDRAVLLATLFGLEHQTVRLAHGTLTTEQTTKLMPGLLAARRAHMSADQPEAASADPLPAIAAKYQLDEAALRTTMQALTADAARRQAALRARVADQVPRLTAAVGMPADTGAIANMNRAVAAFSDHWWVQTQAGTTWRDWDLIGPSSGGALAKADRTVNPDDLQTDAYHQVAIRVVMERWIDGVTSETVALEHTIRTSAVIGIPITLAFVPDAWPKTFPLAGMNVEHSLRSVTLDQHEWTPLLTIGKDHVIQNAITDTGGITMPTGQTDVLAVARGATHGLGGAIDDVFGAAPPPAPAGAATGSFLTAAWIEYEIDSPGEAPQKIRRQVFDLIGPAARAARPTAAPTVDDQARLTRGLALMMTTDILPVSCEFSPQFILHLAARDVLANRAVLSDVVAGKVKDDFDGARTAAVRLDLTGSPLYALAYLRHNLSPENASIYVDRAGLLTSHSYFAPSTATLTPVTATDIVANGVGVDPTGPAAFTTTLAQGVYDTNAETFVPSDPHEAGNTARAFDGAHDWITLTSPADPKVASLRLAPDVRERIRAALASGNIVVAPPAAVPVAGSSFSGWWQIDKVTGRTLGFDAKGWGAQEFAERVALGAIYGAGRGFIMNWIACQSVGALGSCLGATINGALMGFLTGGLLAGTGLAGSLPEGSKWLLPVVIGASK